MKIQNQTEHTIKSLKVYKNVLDQKILHSHVTDMKYSELSHTE